MVQAERGRCPDSTRPGSRSSATRSGGLADTMAMPPAEARATACSMSAMMSSRPTKAPGRQAVVIEGERPQAGKVRG